MDYLFWLFQMKKIEVLFFKYYTPNVEIKDYNVLIDLYLFMKFQLKIRNKLTKQLLN